MNHFLGFFIDDITRKEVVNRTEKISSIFTDMGVDVRWIKPSHYHIKLQNLQKTVGIIRQLYIARKINNVFKSPIKAKVGDIKLGTSRYLKGLLYFEIKKGGDELRELRYEMLKTLRIKDNTQFIPHIAVGRINKDLSQQERSNILRDIENISRNTKGESREFNIDQIDLVRVNEGSYEVLKKFRVIL
jgi:2'-5' RNA ligase